jgi:DNA invertase Pin-like site-specific DNA recombinase
MEEILRRLPLTDDPCTIGDKTAKREAMVAEKYRASRETVAELFSLPRIARFVEASRITVWHWQKKYEKEKRADVRKNPS